jgi:hypothetical protein
VLARSRRGPDARTSPHSRLDVRHPVK